MAKSAIRHLAAASGVSIVAAGEFERAVSMWHVAKAEALSRFDSVLDFGGRRLALTPSADLCFAAAYHVHGIVCYDSTSGDPVWSRSDLKKAQVLKASKNSSALYCSLDNRAFMILDARTGVEISRHRGVREIHESAFGPLLLVEKRDLEIRDHEWRELGRIERQTFATLAAAFSPTHLAISESGAGVRFVRLADCSVVTSYTPATGSHVLDLAYSVEAQAFFAVEWPYVAGGPKHLLRIALDSGAARQVAMIGNVAETVFLNSGSHILTSDGVMLSTASGERIGTLPFPKRRIVEESGAR